MLDLLICVLSLVVLEKSTVVRKHVRQGRRSRREGRKSKYGKDLRVRFTGSVGGETFRKGLKECVSL